VTTKPPTETGETVNEELSAEESLSLAFPSDAHSLAAAREQVRVHLHEIGVDEAAIYAVELTLEELAGNTLRYGYDDGATGSIRVEVSVEPIRVRVTIVDDGRPFDPTQYPEPARSSLLHSAPVGGRGISMVRRAVQALRYRREAGENLIEVDVARTSRSI
jgi:serine/threonine-protein kinase RsbW